MLRTSSAVRIVESGRNENYEDAIDEQARKDSSFADKNYRVALKEGSVKHFRGANVDYHMDGLIYVVETILELCDE